MTDEKFVFVQDIREKKTTARSSHNRKTHAGKGGAVKFPSDYLTKKERNAMNGEITTYRMNDPLTWAEFNEMPDDIRVLYIKALRQRYDVSDNTLAEMFGCHRTTLAREIKRLGVQSGRDRHINFDADGFYKWWKPDEPISEKPEVIEAPPIPEKEVKTAENAVPHVGILEFIGNADASLETVKRLLGNESLKIRVSWEPVEGVVNGG